MTAPFRVARPQSEQEKADDLRSWRNFGAVHREPAPRDPRLCVETNTKYGTPCCAWGSYLIDGKRYCVAHKPDSAERR